MRVFVHMIMLVLLVGMLSGCGGQVGEGARGAVQAVGKLDSAVSVGINYVDYTAEVREAKAIVDGFRPSGRAEDAIHTEVSAAMDLHLMAHEAWKADVDDDWHGTPRSLVDYWTDAYPDVEFDLGPAATADGVRQEAWGRAAEHVENAREMVEQ